MREQAVGGEPGASDNGAAEMFWTHSIYYWFGSLAAAWIINRFTAAPKESNQWPPLCNARRKECANEYTCGYRLKTLPPTLTKPENNFPSAKLETHIVSKNFPMDSVAGCVGKCTALGSFLEFRAQIQRPFHSPLWNVHKYSLDRGLRVGAKCGRLGS
ncbi:hypothetical protein IRJ41_010042 [Triplophysa rosa]|uniref:Uncharacterized protein n=1 Tax=Triplophysa rosa TaxID=992332 RepID=A0A9W7X5U3_TRIRA|nr:hypothetical protein IRJ41_010042 [Triplophysa rosa]